MPALTVERMALAETTVSCRAGEHVTHVTHVNIKNIKPNITRDRR